MENKLAVAFTVILLLAIAAGGLYYSKNLQKGPSPLPVVEKTEKPVVSPSATPSENSVPESWKTYKSEKFGFSIMHPPDLEINEQPENAVQFFVFGPTQKKETEFYDGISLTFRSETYTDDSLEELVESEHLKIKEEPATESVTDIENIVVNQIEGKKFQSVGLGTFTHIYLPAGEGKYLYIVDATADPTDQGLEKTVEIMLSTLEPAS